MRIVKFSNCARYNANLDFKAEILEMASGNKIFLPCISCTLYVVQMLRLACMYTRRKKVTLRQYSRYTPWTFEYFRLELFINLEICIPVRNRSVL